MYRENLANEICSTFYDIVHPKKNCLAEWEGLTLGAYADGLKSIVEYMDT